MPQSLAPEGLNLKAMVNQQYYICVYIYMYTILYMYIFHSYRAIEYGYLPPVITC